MPKLKPLKEFVCDECGEIINSPEEGWIEWLTDSDLEIMYNFRIVHHSGYSPKESCYYKDLNNDVKGSESSAHLDNFLDDEGLARLTALIQDHAEDYRNFKNQKEFVNFLDITRRLQIPYYEEARKYLDKYYLDFTGESQILYSRLNGRELKSFLDWLEQNEINE